MKLKNSIATRFYWAFSLFFYAFAVISLVSGFYQVKDLWSLEYHSYGIIQGLAVPMLFQIVLVCLVFWVAQFFRKLALTAQRTSAP